MWESSEDRLTRRITEEKDLLWKKVLEIDSELNSTKSKLSELEKSAPEHYSKTLGSQRKTAELKNKALEQFEHIQEIVRATEEGHEQFEQLAASINESHEVISTQRSEISTALAVAEDEKTQLIGLKSEYESTIQELKELVDERNALSQRIESIAEQVETSETYAQTLRKLLTSATNERKEIRAIYDDVFGVSYIDDDGVTQDVEGLKDQLETSYLKIKDDLSNLSNELSSVNSTQTEKLQALEDNFKEKTEQAIDSAEEKHRGILSRINALLPSALTAGLSGAYVDKIKVEKEQLIKHEKSFNKAIIGLIACSSIPVAYSISMVLFHNQNFVDVIKDTPTIFSLLLPVYAPILWVAYSSNKSYKLSKRLIEEYTHKEVSSKTFEGLSTQIASIGEDSASGELRTKLLFNLLQVNSENPGKLISDYNNSDHPIIDAIDKSSKLTDAINKLDNVPLVGQLLKHMNAREKAKLAKQNEEIQKVMKAQLEEPSDDLDIEERQKPHLNS